MKKGRKKIIVDEEGNEYKLITRHKSGYITAIDRKGVTVEISTINSKGNRNLFYKSTGESL